MRDTETVDAELRLVAALRRAARERGGPLPSIDVADALSEERGELAEWATSGTGNFHNSRCKYEEDMVNMKKTWSSRLL